MKTRIIIEPTIDGDRLAVVLAHAQAMAETVTVGVNARGNITVELDKVRGYSTPARMPEVAPVANGRPIESLVESLTAPADDPEPPAVPDAEPEPTPSPTSPPTDDGPSTKQRILDHLLDHGPVEDHHGDAAHTLFTAAGIDVGKSARSRLLYLLDQDGLIERTQPTPKRTTRIVATPDAAQARAERTGPWALSARDIVLADLVTHGPVHDPKGGATTVLFTRAGVEVAGAVRSEIIKGLADDGLIERRTSATKTYWVAAIGHGDGTEPAGPTAAERVKPNTVKADLLNDLRSYGPVTDDRGKASAALAVRAGRGEVSAQKVAQAIRELVRDELVVRRGNAMKTYGLAIADDADALDEQLASAPSPATAPLRPTRPHRDSGPAIEGRTTEKPPPAPEITPVEHQGYRVVEVLEEADVDLPEASEEERRARATTGAWPEDFLG